MPLRRRASGLDVASSANLQSQAPHLSLAALRSSQFPTFVDSYVAVGAYVSAADPPFSDGVLKFLGGTSSEQEL